MSTPGRSTQGPPAHPPGLTVRPAAYDHRMGTTCATCSAPLPPSSGPRPRIYCSDNCQWRRPRGQASCPACGDLFIRHKAGQRFCSRACGATSLRPSVTAIPWVSCLHCRTWFVARNGRFTHNPKCRHQIVTANPAPSSTRCDTCSADIAYSGKGRPRRFCSDACGHQSPGFKAGRRRGKSTRRARLQGARTETFDPQEVFDRDRWICHLCNRPTLRTVAVPHPRAATLDHLVPLAKGGEHSRANTACACFDCNVRKGDRTLGPEQLRLLG